MSTPEQHKVMIAEILDRTKERDEHAPPLTSWELGFLRDIRKSIEEHGSLTDPQATKLEKINVAMFGIPF